MSFKFPIIFLKPGRRRVGHVVLVGPLPLLRVRVAGADGRAEAFLPWLPSRDRPRHPLLLGRANGLLWTKTDRRTSL